MAVRFRRRWRYALAAVLLIGIVVGVVAWQLRASRRPAEWTVSIGYERLSASSIDETSVLTIDGDDSMRRRPLEDGRILKPSPTDLPTRASGLTFSPSEVIETADGKRHVVGFTMESSRQQLDYRVLSQRASEVTGERIVGDAAHDKWFALTDEGVVLVAKSGPNPMAYSSSNFEPSPDVAHLLTYARGDGWRPKLTVPDRVIVAVSRSGRYALAWRIVQSAKRHRDMGALVRIEIATGREQIILPRPVVAPVGPPFWTDFIARFMSDDRVLVVANGTDPTGATSEAVRGHVVLQMYQLAGDRWTLQASHTVTSKEHTSVSELVCVGDYAVLPFSRTRDLPGAALQKLSLHVVHLRPSASRERDASPDKRLTFGWNTTVSFGQRVLRNGFRKFGDGAYWVQVAGIPGGNTMLLGIYRHSGRELSLLDLDRWREASE